MLELVFVIVIIGILAAAIIPRMDRDSIYEASEQLLSHIRYTQHLAMTDNIYDVVVVGAGPAGLMAAKTAAENGLKVALIDRKSNIAEIRRCCATMFAVESDYYFGERMYFCEKTKRLVFPVNGFSVNYTGPYKNFYCWHLYTSDAKHYIRLGNYEDKIKLGTKGRLSVTYSKKHLLEEHPYFENFINRKELGLLDKKILQAKKKEYLNGIPRYSIFNITGVPDTGKSLLVEQVAITQTSLLLM